MTRSALLVLCLALLSGCGPAAYRWDAQQADARSDKTYTVQAGDTLYSIAWRYGLDYRDLARVNGIDSNFTIYPGQVLRLMAAADLQSTGSESQATAGAASISGPAPAVSDTASSETRQHGDIQWQRPVSGPIIARFGDDTATGKGVDFGGVVGDPVLASADGRVVYAGSGLLGYGQIIIIKHSDDFLSAYGHNSELYVHEGEQVQRGDRIAAMGRGPGSRPLLHFEIRVDGKAVDPLRYLPR